MQSPTSSSNTLIVPVCPPPGTAVETLSPHDLLAIYWRQKGRPDTEIDALLQLAHDVLAVSADGQDAA